MDQHRSATDARVLPRPRHGAENPVAISIGGNFSGQLAIGDNILQMRFGDIHGSLVVAVKKPPKVSRRPGPLTILPQRPVAFLDRQAEVSDTRTVLAAGQHVAVMGTFGAGRTSLLHHLAYVPDIAGPGGLVFASACGLTRDEVLHLIFDLCYSADSPFKPNPGQLREYLDVVDATILLDDVTLDPADLAQVLDHAPRARFVIAADRDVAVDGLVQLPLSGMPVDAALDLLAACLGRPLSEAELPHAEAGVTAVGGNPLLVKQIATAVRAGLMAFGPGGGAAAGTGTGPPDIRAVLQSLIGALDGVDRRLLAIPAAVPGMALAADDIVESCRSTGGPGEPGEIGDIVNARQRLARLSWLGLLGSASSGSGAVDSHEVEYVAGPDIATALRPPDLAAAAVGLREHFTRWARAPRSNRRRADLGSRVPVALALMRRALSDQCWSEVLDLARAVEASLVGSGRWDAWREALIAQRSAAEALHDRGAEAYALHQLGTLAMCRGEPDAQRLLDQALQIRKTLRDRAGARATQHNLRMLIAPLVLPIPTPTRDRTSPQGRDTSEEGHPGESLPDRALSGTRVLRRISASSLPAKVLLALAPVAIATGAVAVYRAADKGTPVMGFSASALDFPAQPVNIKAAALQVTVVNAGEAAGPAPAVRISGQDQADFVATAEDCAYRRSLAPGARCQVMVQFIPTAAGRRSATLELDAAAQPNAPAAGAPSTRVLLSGVGRSLGHQISASPSQLIFPARTVNRSGPALAVEVRNTAPSALTLGSVTIVGPAVQDFGRVSDSCQDARLDPGESCAVEVSFRPQDVGRRGATLTLAVPGASDIAIPLSGTGTALGDPPVADPTIQVTGQLLVEATGPSGAPVTYHVTALDADSKPAGVTCTAKTGETFSVGSTTVHCSASDSKGRTSSSFFTVTVQDTVKPAWNPEPEDLRREATGPAGANVQFDLPTAVDVVTPHPEVTCAPGPGTLFSLGRTGVTCRAADDAGNSVTTTFDITVEDTTKPTLNGVPEDLVREATGPGGANVQFDLPTATDAVTAGPEVRCAPGPGVMFALGRTQVTCSTADVAGNTATATFDITVRDTTPPTITVPKSPVVLTGSLPSVYPGVSATDLVDITVIPRCTPAPRDLPPPATKSSEKRSASPTPVLTTVTCTARDNTGNVSTETFTAGRAAGQSNAGSTSVNEASIS